MAERVISSVAELKELVGQETRVGDWFLVTQEQINAFTEATGDDQWIHTDVERAKSGLFGVTIAHGLYTLSICLRLLTGGEGVKVDIPTKLVVNYGYNRVRYPSPVPVGTQIRGRSKLLSIDEVQPDIIQQVQQITVEIEGQSKPAMVAEMVTRLYLDA